MDNIKIMNKTKHKKETKLTNEDLVFIFGPEYTDFKEKIIPNCFCTVCTPPANESATIVNYDIFLNDLNDVILRGSCSVCKNPVGRYVETGEVPEYAVRIGEVRGKY